MALNEMHGELKGYELSYEIVGKHPSRVRLEDPSKTVSIILIYSYDMKVAKRLFGEALIQLYVYEYVGVYSWDVK